MALKIIFGSICVILVSIVAGTLTSFAISKLMKMKLAKALKKGK